MTREEQIREAASLYRTDGGEGARGGEEAAFEAGARWADYNPKSSWISAKERKPEPYTLVIVTYMAIDYNGEEESRWIPAFLNDNGLWVAVTYSIGNVRIVENVTHWTEVNLPKMEETENRQ